MSDPGAVAAITRHERTLVMGVVNVTPDSFSDGGDWYTADAAIRHGAELIAAGADLVDVGGESTRPGAARVSVDEEIDRVIPVIAALASQGAAVSVDTTRAVVARAALDAGAVLVNDVSGGLADPEMFTMVAQSGAAYVMMHWRGPSQVMDSLDRYDDVVIDVRRELAARVEEFLASGGSTSQLILDPGLGFAKSGASNWPLMTRINELKALGFPVLVGASRKRFLGHLLSGPGDVTVPPRDRDAATVALTVLLARAGVWGVRVHDAAASVDAIRVVEAWQTLGGER